MNKMTDDDLILLYYGEHEDPSLAARVAQSDELSRRFEQLSAELSVLDELSPPHRGEEFGAEMWRRLSDRLGDEPEPWWRRWMAGAARPRLSLAGVGGFLLVFTVAFWLGREQAGPGGQPELQPGGTPSLAGLSLDADELVSVTVSQHLEQMNVALTRFAHASSEVPDLAGQATDLLVANRIYRQAALSRGEQRLADLLGELEPVLIEIAYEAYKNSPETRNRMQADIRENLLFRIRVMNQRLEQPRVST